MIVGSPRQALAYLYAHHRGPTLARPKYHDAPGGTGRQHWDGALIGAMLPFALRRLEFDPAAASAPFVATIVDVTGIVVYFTVASVLLRTTLLAPGVVG